MEVLVVAIRKLPKGHKSVCFVVTQQIGKGKKKRENRSQLIEYQGSGFWSRSNVANVFEDIDVNVKIHSCVNEKKKKLLHCLGLVRLHRNEEVEGWMKLKPTGKMLNAEGEIYVVVRCCLSKSKSSFFVLPLTALPDRASALSVPPHDLPILEKDKYKHRVFPTPNEAVLPLCDVTFIYEYLKEGGRGDIIIRIGKSSGTLIEALCCFCPSDGPRNEKVVQIDSVNYYRHVCLEDAFKIAELLFLCGAKFEHNCFKYLLGRKKNNVEGKHELLKFIENFDLKRATAKTKEKLDFIERNNSFSQRAYFGFHRNRSSLSVSEEDASLHDFSDLPPPPGLFVENSSDEEEEESIGDPFAESLNVVPNLKKKEEMFSKKAEEEKTQKKKEEKRRKKEEEDEKKKKLEEEQMKKEMAGKKIKEEEKRKEEIRRSQAEQRMDENLSVMQQETKKVDEELKEMVNEQSKKHKEKMKDQREREGKVREQEASKIEEAARKAEEKLEQMQQKLKEIEEKDEKTRTETLRIEEGNAVEIRRMEEVKKEKKLPIVEDDSEENSEDPMMFVENAGRDDGKLERRISVSQIEDMKRNL